MYKEIVQQKLIKARSEMGLTQEEVATLIDEPRTKITKIENGVQAPDIETLGKLAELYEISFDWVFGLGKKDRKEQ